MYTSYPFLPECPPLNKPPGFNGNHYTYWKQKVKDFVKATNIYMWDMFENGYELPKILIDGIAQPKVDPFRLRKKGRNIF